ncbi:MAG: hypothetical protein Kow0077_21690 [Anaerolineae bacterium]
MKPLHPRHLILALILVGLVASIGLAPAGSLLAQGSPKPQTAEGMFAALNEWRLSENLAPFKYNETLEALAWLQLQYILAKPDIPRNIHDGILGEGIRDRALWAPFNWPYYDIPQRINVVEISVAQRTIAQGITWWKNSPIHYESATNPNYREAGVAALPYEYGTVFVAVLGGRPDVLPALVHPDGETLYLTDESFWGQSPTSIGHVRQVRLLDSDGTTPLGDWQPWQPTLPMPEVSGDTLYVEYTDGNKTVTTEVNLTADVIALPGYASAPATEATDQPVAQESSAPPERASVELLRGSPESLVLKVSAPEPVFLSDFHIFALPIGENPLDVRFTDMFGGMTYAAPDTCFILLAEGAVLTPPEACTGPLVVVPAPPEEQFWYDPVTDARTIFFFISANGKLIRDCQDPEASCAFEVAVTTSGPEGSKATPRVTREIELVYNAASFALINRGNQPLNLFGLAFTAEGIRIPIRTWNVTGSSANLGFFPADDCLQLWALGTPRQPKPATCNVRHAWTTVNASEIFWTHDSFNVTYNGATIATCERANGQCTFELPG